MRWDAKAFLARCLALGLIIPGMVTGMVCAATAGEVAYPKRAIDVVVPVSAGGATDTWTRTITPYLSRKWGVPINVINKPGGNTIPATLEV